MSSKPRRGVFQAGLDALDSILTPAFRPRCLTCRKRKVENKMLTPDLCKECAAKKEGKIPKADEFDAKEFAERLKASKPLCLAQLSGLSPAPGRYFDEKKSWTKKKY